jgi:hypothetical protein
MVVIFGFGPGKGEDLGEVVPTVCPNCHNQVFLHHVRSKKSVRLYFVPVVPYGTDDYLVCPVCSRGLQLGAPQLPHLPAMSASTASFRAGRLSEAQLIAQADLFWRELGLHPTGQLPAPASGGSFAPAQPGAPARPGVPGQPGAPLQAPTATPPSPPAADDQAPWIAQLRKLADLHDQGVLSDAAYAAAKRRVIRQEQPPL